MCQSTKVVVAVALVTFVVALDDSRNAQLTHYEYQNDGSGPFRFDFESSDGIKRQEEGTLVHEGSDHAAVIVRGSYSYVGPDGVEYTVRYTADENGFHPEGDHFTVPPFVPWPIHADVEQYTTGESIKGAYQTPAQGYPKGGSPYNYDRPAGARAFNLPSSSITTPKPFPVFNSFQATSQEYLPSTPSPKPLAKRENNDEKFSEVQESEHKEITIVSTELEKEKSPHHTIEEIEAKVVVAVALVTFVVALDDSRNAQLTHYEYQNDGSGPFRFDFESSDGIKREEEGTLVHEGSDHAAVIVRGSYSYVGPDGVEYKVKYTADENGFHPEGDHFSVPPFVPWPSHADAEDVEGYPKGNSGYNYNRPDGGRHLELDFQAIPKPLAKRENTGKSDLQEENEEELTNGLTELQKEKSIHHTIEEIVAKVINL
ncbi:unnamed protein product [Brassicogethes aeneus]|uniref:Uncharacterized protein n=1 Tax=Brassicogethes aeneus TaxID=1431903 RepID=A0A9P0B7G8_BRAAE|nr:unnamed protein product [Brassicogethes aeneus]